jgi:hypothetical protein
VVSAIPRYRRCSERLHCIGRLLVSFRATVSPYSISGYDDMTKAVPRRRNGPAIDRHGSGLSFPANYGPPRAFGRCPTLFRTWDITFISSLTRRSGGIRVRRAKVHRTAAFRRNRTKSAPHRKVRARFSVTPAPLPSHPPRAIDIIHAHNYEGACRNHGQVADGRPLLYNAVNLWLMN